MRVLIYKRTHNGDPDRYGCFGCHDCMGQVRRWAFDAVIGVGGSGPEPQANGIAGKVNWVGKGARKTTLGKRGPKITFALFRDFGTEGPELRKLAPTLATRLYERKARFVMVKLGDPERRDVMKILRLAKDPPLSRCGPTVGAPSHRSRRCVNRRSTAC